MFSKFSQYISEGSVICVSGTLSIEEEKEPKILVNTVLKPSQGNSSEHNGTKKKRRGLFLKFRDENDSRIGKAENLISIFDGDFPVYFYFENTGKYHLQSRNSFVSVNDTMTAELKTILGDKNVVLIC